MFLHREWCLHHSPTVVAWSSMDCNCTGTKGTASDVLRQRRKSRTNDRPPLPPPRSPEGPGGPCKLQEGPAGERKQGEYPYPPVPVKRATPRSSNTKRADEESQTVIPPNPEGDWLQELVRQPNCHQNRKNDVITSFVALGRSMSTETIHDDVPLNCAMLNAVDDHSITRNNERANILRRIQMSEEIGQIGHVRLIEKTGTTA